MEVSMNRQKAFKFKGKIDFDEKYISEEYKWFENLSKKAVEENERIKSKSMEL